ncbi:hypothetical protein IE81DRAFT_344880 [Ceraceosorus guamensis]|uniref:P-loop containing nucleoside triphosphate hydrolase protein n=1 Tax=Ceraceosorus guamensis TaxID=1522189 RepID=A0A316WCC1_9BASI|nr:hypothetical protein IE81DRAFT_344880 [Ceraceosorus guamensis]PWN45185.1 hypothetical protein IE81DRAFT_344880 [Ceraceosorus guamensis]
MSMMMMQVQGFVALHQQDSNFADVLGAFLPFAVLLLAISASLVPASRLPSWLKLVLFDFVTDEDLEEAGVARYYESLRAQADAAEVEEHDADEELSSETQALLSPTATSAPVKDRSDIVTILRPSFARTAALFGLATAQLCWVAGGAAYAGALTASSRNSSGITPSAVLRIIVWSFVLLRLLLKPPASPPYDVVAITFSSLVGATLCAAQQLLVEDQGETKTLSIFGDAISVALLLALLLQLSALPLSTLRLKGTRGRAVALEDSATLASWVTFSWLTPLIQQGSRRDLDDVDVPDVSASMQSSLLLSKILKMQGSLLKRCWRANAHDVVIDACLTFVSAALSIAGPYFLKRILEAIQAADVASGGTGRVPKSAYALPLAAFFAAVCKSQSDVQHLFAGRRAGVRVRGELISQIYHKALKTRAMSAGRTEVEASLPGVVDKMSMRDRRKSKGSSKNVPPDQQQPAGKDLGAIVSLMAVDSQKISQLVSGAYFLYSSPVEILVASIFLYRLLGWSAAVGFSVLLVSTPLQSYLTRRAMHITRELGQARDRRTALIAELYAALRPVRYFAQEEQWTQRVRDAREVELQLLKKRQVLSAGIAVLWAAVPAAITTISFLTYIRTGNRLGIEVAFPAIQTISAMRAALSILPVYITNLLNAGVSMERIETYLAADEVPEWVSTLEASHSPVVTSGKLGFKQATLSWEKADITEPVREAEPRQLHKQALLARAVQRIRGQRDKAGETAPLLPGDGALQPPTGIDGYDSGAATPISPFALEALDVMFPQGKLSLVCGPTASGKSSMLAALLGEMEIREGDVFLPKEAGRVLQGGLISSVAFAAQRPWLQHATVRENILFGAPFEADRYEMVLECCALKPDLVLLPAGDESEVGEGGLVLSGGQRARVALARAMYSRSATVLLDDILSALDAQTSKQVVTTCLNGPLLEGRTCIIVSHHVELVLSIPCALVVKMSHGRIEAQGTPEELREQGHLAAIKAEEAAESIEQDLQAPITGAQQLEPEGLPAAAPSVPALNVGGSLGNAAALAVEVRSRRERGKLVEKERRAKGAMKVQVYVTYLAAYGSITVALALLALVSRQTFDTGEKFYLSFWGSSYSTKATSAAFAVAAAPQQAISFLFSSVGEGITGFHALTYLASDLQLGQVGASALPPANENVWPYLGGFIAIQVAGSACLCLLILINQSGGRNAARALFIQALETLMRATSRHIDMTPKGRVLNTLSKDVGQVDESVHDTMQAMAGYIIGLVTSLGVITLTLPFMLIPSALLAYANYKVAIGYVRTARSLRRIESTSRSPLISSFSELLSGLDTVRAFCAERRLLGKFLQRLDHTQSAFHYFWMCNRHSLLRLDVLGALGIMGASMTALAGGIPAGLAGVALSMASSTTMAIYWLSRYITSLEQDANSLERLQDLITLTPMEASAVIESNRPPASWPSKGAIEVRNLSLQYAPELDPVLHKVTFTVQPGEKIGVVGRTGSGKSTLALALFRHLEYMPGSQILIDGIDVSAIGLRDLRSRLTIIPQDPTLFTGTVRSNLDPFNEHSDEACIEALHRVHLRTTPPVSQPASRMTSRYNTLRRRPSALDGSFASAEDDSGTPGVDGEDEDERSFVTLDSPIADGGTNLSQGQRQLIAMARALLRAGKVIIMDEASSSVDFTTDEAIQSAVQDGFKHSTVLTIAHRLSTVVGYDRILVMDAGRVAEYDTPAALLSKTEGLFKSLCEKSGDYRQLRQVAEEAAEARRSRQD